METEIEQEGNENAWRTADLRIRKTQVPFLVTLHVSYSALNIVLSCACLYLCSCSELEDEHKQKTDLTPGQVRIIKAQVVQI